MRISDGNRSRTYSQGLMVWHDDRSSRVFHGVDMHVKQFGLLMQQRTFRLPRVVNLMVPGEVSSVPRNMEIKAHAWSDHINLHLGIEDYAQVGVPNDGPEGLTLLSEATGDAQVSGRIGGKDVSFNGRALMEFNYGAR